MSARSLSSRKRQRQNVKRAAINASRKTTLKNRVAKVREALAARDPKAAEALFREAAAVLDRGANRDTIHPNTAARRKSRLAKRLNAIKGTAKK